MFAIGNRAKKYRGLYRLANRILPVVSMLMFFAALAFRRKAMQVGGEQLSLPGIIFLLLVSIGIHEIGHLIVGIAHGEAYSEAGFLFWGPLPISAYVLREGEGRLPRGKNLQLYLAGIQMNLIFAGFLKLFSAADIFCAGTFCTVAQINFWMAFINLLPADSFDGSCILSALLGIEDLGAGARPFINSKKYRRSLLHAEAKGRWQILSFLLHFAANTAVRIFMVFDLLCILICIILLLI